MTGSSRGGLPKGFAAAAFLAISTAAFVPVLRPAAWPLGYGLAVGGTILMLVGVTLLVVRHYPHDRFGLCNTVTLARAAMVVALLALLWSGARGWEVMLVAAVALSLDGLDGWLARRSELVSEFGARFDMETDAALGLVLAAHVWLGGMTGPEVLLLGLMRYGFVLAFWPFPWLAAALPERFGRKAVCVIQIAMLILLQLPGLMPVHAQAMAWFAVIALVWSFGRDVLWLWRHRA